MTDRIIFEDLGRRIYDEPRRTRPKAAQAQDDLWLSELAAEVTPSSFLLPMRLTTVKRRSGDDHEPLLTRQPDGSWRAGRFIGEIRRGDRILEIRPRLSFPTITAWAGAALNLTVLPRSAGRSGMSYLIAELQAATWRRALTDASRHGMPGIRAEQHHRGPMVRGRLDIEKTINLRARRSPHVASISTPKIIDNPVTRAIVLADRALDRKLHRKGWRGERLDNMLPHLRAAVGARPILPTLRELGAVRYTPITLRYRAAAELSWLIARDRAPGGDTSSDSCHGVLLDVAELWELFLLHCIRLSAPGRQVTHGTTSGSTALLTSSVDPTRTMGKLYPDFVLTDADTSPIILDAKYKRIRDPFPVAREDLYQLTSYLAGFAHGANRGAGMLLYPQLDTEPSTAETLGPWQIGGGGLISFVRLPVNERECVMALRRLLG